MHLAIIGGSDAGISAALRARELDPAVDITVLLADAYPNFSICGIPYYISGAVERWEHLAHRTVAELESVGIALRLNTTAQRIDAEAHTAIVRDQAGTSLVVPYHRLVVATGAAAIAPPIAGLSGSDALGSDEGVHLLHTMEDAFAVMRNLQAERLQRAVIVGAGYIGLEIAEALTERGLAVTQVEQLPEVLPTVDWEIGSLIHAELSDKGVDVRCGTAVTKIARAGRLGARGLEVSTTSDSGPEILAADIVLVVAGVRPDSWLAAEAGVAVDPRGAIQVDRRMRTSLPDIFAAGDCVATYHRLLGMTYLPLGTTAHKQGRVAGENALGGSREFEGSLGTQVVKIFDMAVARTGLRDREAFSVGFSPETIAHTADDHKAYFPGSRRLSIRLTGDRASGRLLGVQMFGHRHSEVAKRIDAAAVAIFHEMTVDGYSDLDLSYTPPLGSPWDAIQAAAQVWVRTVGDGTNH
ncbi:MAG: FAD-dependent oxidoreductase [Candidatus Dormibacteria bacterium]